tara:strand:- start:847 stop:1812 length:966 start_codon:yes stop_codon:yes gene_type:complete
MNTSNLKYTKEDFHNEITKLHIDKTFNPYLILNISKKYSQSELKEQYKKFSMLTHPDKGGDPEHFNLVTKSYLYLLKALKDNLPEKDIYELKNNYNSFLNEQTELPKTNINFNGQNFNINKFNNIFNDSRIKTELDDGYNNFLQNDGVEENIENIENDDNYIFSDNFNLEVFNKIFNIIDKKKKNIDKNTCKQLIKIEEPSELYNNFGYELGVNKITDFSKGYSYEGHKNQQLDYTDIKVAHTTSKLVDESLVTMPEWKNVDDLKQARNNISYNLSERDKVLIEQRQLYKDNKEKQRLENINKTDKKYTEHFNKVHKLLIN